MALTLVYDDLVPVPAEVANLIGITRFGDLLHRKRPLAASLRDVAMAARVSWTHLRTEADRRALLADLDAARSSDWFVYQPASLTATVRDALTLWLRKVAYTSGPVHVRPNPAHSRGAVLVVQAAELRRLLCDPTGTTDPIREACERSAELPNTPAFLDLTDYPSFVGFLTSHFQVRFFNAIAFDELTVVKRSTDKAKMRREAGYYHHLPDALKPYFLPTFGFTDHGADASYRLERLNVPDMAVQWVHGALTPEEFAGFLDRVFRFLMERPRKAVPNACDRARTLYLGKLRERMAKLTESPVYPKLAGLVRDCTGLHGLPELADRYTALFEQHWIGAGDPCVSHGDPCFSNILFDKRTRLMKFIDPRGADNPDDLYLDPYYDVAKLSHSILGGYDFINNDLFDLEFDASLGLSLVLPDRDQIPHREAFRARLQQCGFDYRTVRLCEASLFLSMLPLHQDVPKKTLGFVLTAARILDEVEAVSTRAERRAG